MSPDLACVVMSFRGREDVVRAVTSLVRQDVRAEILVVNSGGGSPAERLRDAGLAVPVLDVPEPLTPGAARNAGIAATRAPFVAFLAADCWAAPGWIAGRVREHRGGAAAVAARVVNPYPRSLSACAFHVAVHGRRLVPGPRGLGLSYPRAWLEQAGPFLETASCGEDGEMRTRLGPEAEVAAPADVHTFHDHPTRPSDLTRDMVKRGRRLADAKRRHSLPDRPPAALHGVDHVVAALGAAVRGTAELPRGEVARGLPLALPAVAAIAAGALTPGGRAI